MFKLFDMTSFFSFVFEDSLQFKSPCCVLLPQPEAVCVFKPGHGTEETDMGIFVPSYFKIAQTYLLLEHAAKCIFFLKDT